MPSLPELSNLAYSVPLTLPKVITFPSSLKFVVGLMYNSPACLILPPRCISKLALISPVTVKASGGFVFPMPTL